VRRLLVTANFFPSSPILVTLIMEALRSSETSIRTRATRRNIPEDAILYVKAVHRNSPDGDVVIFICNTLGALQ
jgi:hypothetical protein